MGHEAKSSLSRRNNSPVNYSRAFTLLELIVVIIIVGILATLGLNQYTKMIENGRSAEAKSILGEVRTLQTAYYTEKGAYATSFSDLGVTLPANCTTTHYYRYWIDIPSGPFAVAQRCCVGGKTPDATCPALRWHLYFATGVWLQTYNE